MTKLKRRDFLKGMASLGATACILARMKQEPSLLEVTKTRCALKEGGESIIRALHLSDFHLDHSVPLSRIEEAITLGLEGKPEIIFLTGDYITHRLRQKEEYILALSRLSAAAPTYAVMGNHDGGAWSRKTGIGYQDSAIIREILSAAGIECLHNANTEVNVSGKALRVVGVPDLWSEDILLEKAFSGVKPGKAPIILLSHNPDSKDTMRHCPWDIMLSGHTHGGQIVIPGFNVAPVAPIKDIAFVAGLVPWGKRLVYVTRGVGTTVGLRFNCRPEVSILELVV